MPETTVRAFKDVDDCVPVVDWLAELEASQPKVYEKFVSRVLELSEKGHQMRRPNAATLRNGIYELRVRRGTVNYRILYFFYGECVAALSHGITKKDKVPDKEIDIAIARMELVKKDPDKYTADIE